MKIGTILRNDYVSDDSPLRYVIYVGNDGKYLHAIYPFQGKIKRGRYYKQDVGEGMEISPVGYTDVLNRMVRLIEEDISDFKEEMENADT